MLEDTIIAISTPPGYGGLGIVRLSGPRALGIAKCFFRPRHGRIAPGKPVLGDLHGPGRGGAAFDEAFLTFHKKPHSYTREDVVEISCHGSPVVLEEVIRLGVRAGARPADPGEFTLRAYINGRLDIIQAEAVNDLIRAASLTQARISFAQLGGSLSKRICSVREKLIHLLAGIEATIEFPDEDLRVSRSVAVRKIDALVRDIETLVAGYEAGRPLAEGITLAIVGKTNVGKSTLFNALLGQDRAIVTPYPGTTRDFIREKLIVRDSVFHLIDTAGLGRPNHPVEKEGMRRSERQARDADGVLLVLDGSRPPGREDERLLEKFRESINYIIINKIDLRQGAMSTELSGMAGGIPVVEISALKGTNIDGLKTRLHDMFTPSKRKPEDVVLHLRQKLLLEEMLAGLERSRALFRDGHPDEIVAEELRGVLSPAGRLTGEIRANEVIEDIFGRFCVGK
jgi:tRNA modification GTPase